MAEDQGGSTGGGTGGGTGTVGEGGTGDTGGGTQPIDVDDSGREVQKNATKISSGRVTVTITIDIE